MVHINYKPHVKKALIQSVVEQRLNISLHTWVIQEVMQMHLYLCNDCRPSFEIRPVYKYVYEYYAFVISRSSSDGLHFKEDLIDPTKLNMATKFRF